MFSWMLQASASIIWPLYAVGLVVLCILAWRQHRHATAGRTPPLWILGALLLAPLTVTIWGAVTYGAERGAPPGKFGWASSVLTALALGVVGFAGWGVWRWRSRWLTALPFALACVAGAAIAWFIGAMAIADDWI